MSDDPSEPPRFAAALTRLEELVTSLESGSLDLEMQLSSFEEGVKLVRLCSERLRAAELRVQKLEESVDGPQERPLDLEAGK
jgi:exodeoxyribonuclease VII small subunit